MRVKIELDPNDLPEDAATLDWLADEHKWKRVLSEFSSHLRRKYKHNDPEGSEEAQKARLNEIEVICDKFWELVEENECRRDWI